ncbi:zinc finger CCCH domain-containing protein 14-like [Mirounga leonina]|uniref:zinc finger CCCH domain-containing protein 14-like n=1 Tax=Mirounga leonina TaxID=9715 RepID=UPI00156BEAB0|nr:zinc finger CCCH domain-containing protein 14-like [Mirounga leonina]
MHRVNGWIQMQDQTICCLQKTHFNSEDVQKLKVKGWKMIFQAYGNQKEAGIALLTLDKTDFKTKRVTGDRGHDIMTKRYIVSGAGPVGAGHADRAAGSSAGGWWRRRRRSCGAGSRPGALGKRSATQGCARRPLGAVEIGTEVSRKIRSAIKGKLQELGAYVDEELPGYITVMVANKKSQDQMTEDLSLFLGNNTIRFTVWLHGVLDKLRSVTTDPSSLKSSDTNIFDNNVSSNKSWFSRGDERRHEAAVPPLAVASARPEKRDSRGSTSSQEQKPTTVRQT